MLAEMCKVSLEEVQSALPRVRKELKMMEGAHLEAEQAALYDEETEVVSTRAVRPARHDQRVRPEGSGGDCKACAHADQHKPTGDLAKA